MGWAERSYLSLPEYGTWCWEFVGLFRIKATCNIWGNSYGFWILDLVQGNSFLRLPKFVTSKKEKLGNVNGYRPVFVPLVLVPNTKPFTVLSVHTTTRRNKTLTP